MKNLSSLGFKNLPKTAECPSNSNKTKKLMHSLHAAFQGTFFSFYHHQVNKNEAPGLTESQNC